MSKNFSLHRHFNCCLEINSFILRNKCKINFLNVHFCNMQKHSSFCVHHLKLLSLLWRRLDALFHLFCCWLHMCGSPSGLNGSKQATFKVNKVLLELLGVGFYTGGYRLYWHQCVDMLKMTDYILVSAHFMYTLCLLL